MDRTSFILPFRESDRESPQLQEKASTAKPKFKPRPTTAGTGIYIERIVSCLEEEVDYPLPSPNVGETWNTSYLNFRYHRGDLEAGNTAPADDIEAHCLFETWHNSLWRSGRGDDTQSSDRDRTIVAISNALKLNGLPPREAPLTSLPSKLRRLRGLPTWATTTIPASGSEEPTAHTHNASPEPLVPDANDETQQTNPSPSHAINGDRSHSPDDQPLTQSPRTPPHGARQPSNGLHLHPPNPNVRDSDMMLQDKANEYSKCIECRFWRRDCDQSLPACSSCLNAGVQCRYSDPKLPSCTLCIEKRKGCEGVVPCRQCIKAGAVCVFKPTPIPKAGVDCEACRSSDLNCDRILPTCNNCSQGSCRYLLESGSEMLVAPSGTVKTMPARCGFDRNDYTRPVVESKGGRSNLRSSPE